MSGDRGYQVDWKRITADLFNCDCSCDELQKAYGDQSETSRVLPTVLQWICTTDSDLTDLFKQSNATNKYLEHRNRESDGCKTICALRILYDESRHGDPLSTSKGCGLSFGPNGKGLAFPLNYGGQVKSSEEIAISYERRGQKARLSGEKLANYKTYLDGRQPIVAVHKTVKWLHTFVNANRPQKRKSNLD